MGIVKILDENVDLGKISNPNLRRVIGRRGGFMFNYSDGGHRDYTDYSDKWTEYHEKTHSDYSDSGGDYDPFK